jgi:hypothetical protein
MLQRNANTARLHYQTSVQIMRGSNVVPYLSEAPVICSDLILPSVPFIVQPSRWNAIVILSRGSPSPLLVVVCQFSANRNRLQLSRETIQLLQTTLLLPLGKWIGLSHHNAFRCGVSCALAPAQGSYDTTSPPAPTSSPHLHQRSLTHHTKTCCSVSLVDLCGNELAATASFLTALITSVSLTCAMATTNVPVTLDTQIVVKIQFRGQTKKFKLPLKDLGAHVLPEKVRCSHPSSRLGRIRQPGTQLEPSR